MKAKREREEACNICGHYHDYEGGVPCSVCGHRLQHTTEKGQQPNAYPSEILPGFLYLGSYDNASRCELLKAMDITHILNTVPSSPNLYNNSFKYETVAEVPPNFAACNRFIDSAKDARTRVLVHCMSGITRSPAVVCAYLMHLRRWRLTESFKWLADKHPKMQLSPGDQKRLIDFEVQTLGSSSVGFGGLQLLQTSPAAVSAPQRAQLSPQQQPGGLFSWSGASPAAALQQPQHTLSGGTPPPACAPQLGFSLPQSGAQFSGFSFSPGASTGGFVFGATSQQ